MTSHTQSAAALIIEGLRAIPDAAEAPRQVGGIRQETHAPQDGFQAWIPGEPEEEIKGLALEILIRAWQENLVGGRIS